jgi:hypothetical protein
MDYRKCRACGLSNLSTVAACFRCGAALGNEPDREPAATLINTSPPNFATPDTRPIQLISCPACGNRIDAGSSRCQFCNNDLVPADSAGFYQARLVPDSGFRRAQQAAEPIAENSGGRSTTVTVFAVLNFVMSIVALLGGGLWMMGIASAALGDAEAQKALGGFFIFLLPNVIYFLLFLAAGIGLMKRTTWGYYVHLTTAILAGFSCIGLAYTIPALIFAFQPDFKRDFRSR